MKANMIRSVAAAAVLAVLAGCTAQPSPEEELLSQKEQEISRLNQELEASEAAYREELARKDVALKAAQDAQAAAAAEAEKASKRADSLVPPDAKPGECYAKVLVPAFYEDEPVKRLVKEAKTEIKIIPATYKVIDKRVTIRGASKKIVVVPATYKTVTEEVMVTPAKTELVTVPATYKSVTEQVMVEPEKTELVVVPATYKTVTEKVLVSPAHTMWKEGRGEIEKVDHATGDIMCLVEVPAVYKTVTKKVLDVDAHTRKVVTPAVYKTVTKKVVDTPATTKKVVTPAVYKTVKKTVLDTPATTKEVTLPAICKNVKVRVVDTPASEEKIEIPAKYETYTKRVRVSEPYLRWQSILCETNTNKDVVSRLQKALKDKGYKITAVDGDYGPETKAAVDSYQKDHDLSRGALTLKTLQSLGLR